MANTTLVYSPTRDVHTTSIPFISPMKPSTKYPGRKTSSYENQVPKVSGMENYRQTLEIEGISSNAAKLISTFRKPGSIAGYESSWNKWVSWCCQQQVDPVCAPLDEILNYLSVWKRPTISNYKFTPLCYFSVPRLCRWKACWETS